MSKSFIYNLILTIVAIVVFIFIGASVYDAFTRNPVNRGLDGTAASTVSGQIEAATPTATQPGQPTPADNAAGDSTSSGTDAASTTRDKKQADAAYDQTNDPTRSAPPAERTTSDAPNTNEPAAAASSARPDEAPAPATSPARTAPAPRQEPAPSPSTSIDPAAPAGTSAPAARSNPDLRSVIPPVPTAPPRAEGTRPPVTTDQDMYNATDSGQDNGNISDSFPAPVSNFPAPVGSDMPDNNNTNPRNTNPPMGAAPGSPSPEQQRLEELRRQKEQLRRDMGF
ncbi:hypothetical protein W822_15205 [Advenella kashmirensis W13003]|uniref:Uncharacterized protein n=1 Tax=Advenella kashmirensis W13003 TaxID=1424334 RepID=V8QTR6_9BURK|nr:hypothetical protein [Advenella kashmirensis]ETF02404.1 hypothetical protein W822_15205 [Advenella kashmirensis W13003]